MTEANGPPSDELAAPSPGENLRHGLTGSPAAKLKLIVMGAIALGIVAVVLLGSKKSEESQPKPAPSKVAVSEVDLQDDDPGGSAANPEVDSLITQVEAQREKAAITEGNTYVAPVPDLDAAPPPAAKEPAAQVSAPPTVSIASQQSKLAALQGLDERLNGVKSGVPAETQFQQAKTESTGAGSGTTAANPQGSAQTDKSPVTKQFPAGQTRWFAMTITAIDSDVPGPITAQIEQGPFAGATVLGSYEITGRKYVTMTFTRLVFEGTETPINAIGVDPNNGLAGIAGDVNNRWGSRLILPTLVAAVGKYAEAATFGGTTSISSGGTVVQEPELSTSEKLQYALGSGVQTGVTPALQEEANSIKRQVSLPARTPFALMLVDGI